jgi:hypothetical protein
MSIFYAATTITLGNECKTPFWHADTAGRFVIWSECLRHFPASIFQRLHLPVCKVYFLFNLFGENICLNLPIKGFDELNICVLFSLLR